MASSSSIRFSRPPAAASADLPLPVGFRFHPTDEELVSHYLRKKLQGRDDLVGNIIREIELYNYEPWDLPAVIPSDGGEEWYFFNQPQYKHNRNNQTVRTTNEGYWKITGRERAIKARENRIVIGKMRPMTFYIGRVRKAQKKTNWVIHEYYIPDEIHRNAKQRDLVVCRLKKKSDDNADVATPCDEGETSTHHASDFENQLAHNMEIPVDYIQPPGDSDLFFGRHKDRLLDIPNNNESDDDSGWVDGLIVDPDQDSYQETTRTTVFNDSTRPQSLRRVYVDDSGVSSDTDAEVFRGQDMSLQMLGEAQGSSSHSRRDKAVMLRNQQVKQSASSVSVVPKPPQKPTASSFDVDPYVAQIKCLQLVTDDYYRNEKTSRRTYPPGGVTALGNSRELKQQQSKAKEASEHRIAVDLPQKKPSMTKSNSITEVAQGNSAEKGMKKTQDTTKASSWKGSSFVSWETPPLTSPPSVYIVNAVLGAILFLILAWEAVLYG